MLLAAQCDHAMAQRLAEELAEVENRFNAELLSDLACVNELVTHIERYRGKMLRPMLVLSSAMAASPSGQDVVDAHRVVATVVEMVHMATLVHDDVLDEATTRRRGDTINHLRGNEAAVMLGDYLISHAYHLCSSLSTPDASRLVADATNVVCEGELLQLANRNNWALDERTYFEIIRRKTASLCGMCCRLGAQLADAPHDAVEGLQEYGEKVGIAFQIVDDVLDLTGTEEGIGKSVGRDLEKGKLTLPLIHCLTQGHAVARTQLLGILSGETPHENRPQKVVELVRENHSLEYANDWAQRLISEAKAALAPLANSQAKSLLIEMADAVLTRKF